MVYDGAKENVGNLVVKEINNYFNYEEKKSRRDNPVEKKGQDLYLYPETRIRVKKRSYCQAKL